MAKVSDLPRANDLAQRLHSARQSVRIMTGTAGTACMSVTVNGTGLSFGPGDDERAHGRRRRFLGTVTTLLKEHADDLTAELEALGYEEDADEVAEHPAAKGRRR